MSKKLLSHVGFRAQAVRSAFFSDSWAVVILCLC